MVASSELGGIGRGWSVYSADGAKIGDVDEAFPTYIKLRQGLIFKHDLFIPAAAISALRGTEVRLNVPEREVSLLGWDTPPDTAARPWVTVQRVPVEDSRRALADRAFVSNPLRIPIRTEEVHSSKTPVIASELVIRKESVVQRMQVDASRRRSDVTVEQRDRSESAAEGPATAQPGQPGHEPPPLAGTARSE